MAPNWIYLAFAGSRSWLEGDKALACFIELVLTNCSFFDSQEGEFRLVIVSISAVGVEAVP